MKFFEIILWIALIYVAYVQLIYILFKGKQYNRLFASFINTIVPIVGSVPAFIIASKFEKRIGGITTKVNENLLRRIQIGLQILSVIVLFLPFFSNGSASISGMNLIFGKASEENVVRPTLILIYLVVFPLVCAAINYFYNKNNINTFISYSCSLLNVISLILLKFVVASGGTNAKIWLWLYCLINVGTMFISTVLMVVCRNKFLYKLENQEKSQYIKEQQTGEEQKVVNNTYKCAKCGNDVLKGTICSCIERRLSVSKEASFLDENSTPPDSYCIYCKKPLAEGEGCNCLGDGFGITIKNESPKSRKCLYCGQLLIGESTCVCEKIMKNSEPAQNQDGKKEEPKHFFEAQVEKSSNIVADELSELQKKINSRFEQVKETMNLSSGE